MPAEGKVNLARYWLRVARCDWSKLVAGAKTEYRQYANHHADLHTPSPIVIYPTRQPGNFYEERLMVIEDFRQEPLGAISPESLANEGFETLKDFRRYWNERHGTKGYRGLNRVHVFSLRPWTVEDSTDMAMQMLMHLYGPWLDGPKRDAP